MRRALQIGSLLTFLLAGATSTVSAQQLEYRTQAYAAFTSPAHQVALRQWSLVRHTARYWPHTSTRRLLLGDMRPQFMGRLAEDLLVERYPELRIPANANHPATDVFSSCRSGRFCIHGRLGFQVKVHQGGDPATYFRDFSRNARYDDQLLLVPREHRDAVRRYAREHGRPDIAERVTDRYDLSSDELEAMTRNATVARVAAWTVTAVALAFDLVHLAHACSDTESGECGAMVMRTMASVGGIALSMSSTRVFGIVPLAIGWYLGAAFDVVDAFNEYGWSWRFGVAAGIAVVGAYGAWQAGAACAAAFAATVIGSLIAGAVCAAAVALGARMASNALVSSHADLSERAQAVETDLRRQLNELVPADTVSSSP